jgi:hypothetical protein
MQNVISQGITLPERWCQGGDVEIQGWEVAAKVVAIFAGTAFGSAAIGAASWVWLRKQVFAYGGSALCLSGVVLVGLSFWPTVEFVAGRNGLIFKAAQQAMESSVTAAQKADAAKSFADASISSAAKALEKVRAMAASASAPSTEDDEQLTHLMNQAKNQAEQAKSAAEAAKAASEDASTVLHRFGL